MFCRMAYLARTSFSIARRNMLYRDTIVYCHSINRNCYSSKKMENSDLGTRAFTNPTQCDSRPSYLKEPVEIFLNKVGVKKKTIKMEQPLVILELGAGTGKFTRTMVDVLKEYNVKILASDPKENMCQKFRQNLPDIELLKFPAQQIELPDESVHSVVAANSLHWFSDSQRSFDEISRVLVPGGMFGVFWFNPDFNFSWIAEIGKYIEPLYQQQGTLFEPLNQGHYIDCVKRSGKFQSQGHAKLQMFTWHTDKHSALDLFLSAAVFTASEEKVINDFKLFFQRLTDKHFLKKGGKLLTVPFEETMFWFEKSKDDAST